MRIFKLCTVLLFAFTLTGCGAFVISETDITSNGAANTKSGMACAKNILGVVATGDASIAAAARKGGIKKVATVDTVGKPGFFTAEYCTKVTGQ